MIILFGENSSIKGIGFDYPTKIIAHF